MFSFPQPGLHLFTLQLEAGRCWELPGPSAPLCGGFRPGGAWQATLLSSSPHWALPPSLHRCDLVLCWGSQTSCCALGELPVRTFLLAWRLTLTTTSLVPGLSQKGHRAFIMQYQHELLLPRSCQKTDAPSCSQVIKGRSASSLSHQR